MFFLQFQGIVFALLLSVLYICINLCASHAKFRVNPHSETAEKVGDWTLEIGEVSRARYRLGKKPDFNVTSTYFLHICVLL